MNDYEKIQDMRILLIVEIFANVKRFGFYIKLSSERLNM